MENLLYEASNLRNYLIQRAAEDKTSLLYWELPNKSVLMYHRGWYKPRIAYSEKHPGTKHTDWGWSKCIAWIDAYQNLTAARLLETDCKISSQV